MQKEYDEAMREYQVSYYQYHLALASYYQVHYLLTWNCRHLANVNKVDHLRSINQDLGLYVPMVTTPDLLFAEDIDDDQG